MTSFVKEKRLGYHSLEQEQQHWIQSGIAYKCYISDREIS